GWVCVEHPPRRKACVRGSSKREAREAVSQLHLVVVRTILERALQQEVRGKRTPLPKCHDADPPQYRRVLAPQLERCPIPKLGGVIIAGSDVVIAPRNVAVETRLAGARRTHH